MSDTLRRLERNLGYAEVLRILRRHPGLENLTKDTLTLYHLFGVKVGGRTVFPKSELRYIPAGDARRNRNSGQLSLRPAQCVRMMSIADVEDFLAQLS